MLRTICSVYMVFRYSIQESSGFVFGPFPIKLSNEHWIDIVLLWRRGYMCIPFCCECSKRPPSGWIHGHTYLTYVQPLISRSRWPRGLRPTSAAARLLRSWVRIPSGHWCLSVVSVCVLSGRGLCVGLITRTEEDYRLWCVVVCDLETAWMRRPWPTGGLLRQKQTNKHIR